MLLQAKRVAPYAGAWIEISTMSVPMLFGSVAPYAGAWIEIERWVLKWLLLSRSLRGGVD